MLYLHYFLAAVERNVQFGALHGEVVPSVTAVQV